jgi:hypothetical protein
LWAGGGSGLIDDIIEEYICVSYNRTGYIALFEGSGKTMRHIKIRTLDDIDEKRLVKLIKLVCEKSVCSH